MATEMDIIQQTGKTILFEEFNKDKMDLVTLLTKDEEELSQDKFTSALMGKDGLAVESFEEFVEKFAPTIYETLIKTENGAKFVYTLEKPSFECNEISLKDHAFYKMILSLLDRKATTDKGNIEFPYEDLKKLLTPEAEMETCMQIRKNYITNCKEYYELEKKNAPKIELLPYIKNIKASREKIISKYNGKSPLGLLPVAIADVQKRIELLQKARETTEEITGTPQQYYRYSFDNSGNLELIEQSISDNAQEVIENNENRKIVEVLKNDYENYAPVSIRGNNYIANMIISVFASVEEIVYDVQNIQQLQFKIQQYQNVYKDSLESFSKAVSEVVEKFVGVKSFFDHAALKGILPKEVSFIVANCKITAILNDEVAKKRFQKYFNNLATEKSTNRIWFAILPAILENNNEQIEEDITVLDPFGDLDFTATTEKKKTNTVTLSAAKEMLALLKEAKIMTFVSYKGSEQTGFTELTSKKVENHKKDFGSVDSEYAVFAYPNFTILPKEKGAVKIGTEYGNEIEKNVYITLPGIYLDACYVAAGMMVGIQNYKFLEAKGYYVNPQYPCVRFDIEEEENSKRILTKLNRETITEMPKEIKDEIMSDRFGFVFADNRIVYNGKIINNSYVLNARTLKKNENGIYKSIYKTLVRNFVNQLLHSEANIITENAVKKFLKGYVKKWKMDNNNNKDRAYANRILFENESIDLDSKQIQVTFQKEQEIWKDIEIKDMEGEF